MKSKILFIFEEKIANIFTKWKPIYKNKTAFIKESIIEHDKMLSEKINVEESHSIDTTQDKS